MSVPNDKFSLSSNSSSSTSDFLPKLRNLRRSALLNCTRSPNVSTSADLSRTATHRAAMLSNMACSLIKHKRINTTLAKAKALKKYVEPLITRCKVDTTASRRVVFRYLQDKYVVTELFGEVSQKVANRPGGYTRIIKTGFRPSDGAEMCFIELVDYNEHMAKTEKKAPRTRRSGKKSAAPVAETAPVAEETAAE